MILIDALLEKKFMNFILYIVSYQLLPEVSNMMADLDAIALNNEVVKIHHPVVEYPSKVTIG
jgi:hypothetical protein